MEKCILRELRVVSWLAEHVQVTRYHSNEGWLWRASDRQLPNLSSRSLYHQCLWPVWTESLLPNSKSARRLQILSTDPPGSQASLEDPQHLQVAASWVTRQVPSQSWWTRHVRLCLTTCLKNQRSHAVSLLWMPQWQPCLWTGLLEILLNNTFLYIFAWFFTPSNFIRFPPFCFGQTEGICAVYIFLLTLRT